MKTDGIIFETKFWQVILSDDQEFLGRCVIVARDDAHTLSDLTSEQWLDFEQVVKKLEDAAKKAFGATMFNWTCLMNHAYRESPPNPHVHWHFRPRYEEPTHFAGEIFEDRAFGSHYERGTERIVSDEIRSNIIAAYQKALE